jgi:hypothetical protein
MLFSGFCCDLDEICALLGYSGMVLCGNCIPTFWDNISVLSSRAKSLTRKESQAAYILSGKVQGGESVSVRNSQ